MRGEVVSNKQIHQKNHRIREKSQHHLQPSSSSPLLFQTLTSHHRSRVRSLPPPETMGSCASRFPGQRSSKLAPPTATSSAKEGLPSSPTNSPLHPPTSFLVSCYFRGTWCPACRTQLAELNGAAPALAAQGIAVRAITAEPGGTAALQARLVERGTPGKGLGFDGGFQIDVISDEHHATLLPELVSAGVYLTRPFKWNVSGPYSMIQPTLVVQLRNSSGAVLEACTWSFSTMGYTEDEDMEIVATGGRPARRLEQSQSQKVAGPRFVGLPQHDVPLCLMRPITSDLGAAISERRAVDLGVAYDVECE